MNPQSRGHAATLRSTGGFFRIGPRARFVVSGSDALRYLNGQLTVDIARLEPESSRSALLLTAKGKICIPVFVVKHPDGFLLEAPPELRDELAARLERYIIADDVVVTDDSVENAGFHVFGPPLQKSTISRVGLPGTDLPTPPANVTELTPDEVELLRIAAGIPAWSRELDADTLVQEARMDHASVDFDKGCYVGQEVVSRLKSVGRVNRLLHGFLAEGNCPITHPLRLAPETQPDAAAGTLTSSAHDFELARTLALGYLHRNFETVNRFLAIDAAGQVVAKVEKCELPIP